jgi:hypothetical protein
MQNPSTKTKITIMKRFIPILLGFGLLAFVQPNERAHAIGDEVTITGKLIDTKCYGMNHANHGNDHVAPGTNGEMTTLSKCATACAGMGIPVGLLEGGEKGAKVYVLITPAGALAEHQAKDARVTGMSAYGGGIIPTKVEVKEGAKWVDVTPAGMM